MVVYKFILVYSFRLFITSIFFVRFQILVQSQNKQCPRYSLCMFFFHFVTNYKKRNTQKSIAGLLKFKANQNQTKWIEKKFNKK